MTAPAERLEQIRTRMANASTDYALAFADGHEALTAVIFKGTEPAEIARLTVECPYGDRDLLLHAAADMAFLDGLVRQHGRLNAELRSRIQNLQRELARRQGKPDADYAAECAMKCADRAFVRWLIEQHGLDERADDKKIVARVRSVLAIRSRGELNDDLQAANRWRAMVRDFENWRRR